MRKSFTNKNGFTLIEALVGAAVFAVLAMSVYQSYTAVLDVVNASRTKISATALANEQFEIARNLPYRDVGTTNGVPGGKIAATQNLTRDSQNFTVKTTIRSIDDIFDGTIASTTDLSPADYKMMGVEVSCETCKRFSPLTLTTNIGPRDLESESTNGSLFIRVFDGNAEPLPAANIHITNNEVFPPLQIDEVTNNNGLLQIVDAPPAVNSYQITVSKKDYSTEKSYLAGALENPNPINKNPVVVVRQLTQISFFLNLVSDLNIKSLAENCTAIPNIDFSLKGTRLIGTEPDILKHNATSTTDTAGEKIITDLDYDTYTLTMDDLNYALLGISTTTTINLNTVSAGEIKFTLAEKLADSLLVTVKDSSGLPISGANVELLIGATSTATEVTGPGVAACRQEGQVLFTNLTPETYNMIITKTGYQNYTETINLGSIWQKKEVTLNP